MSSNFGAISPLMDRIQALRKMGGQAVDTLSRPGEMLQHMLTSPNPEQQHQQAIQQMNAQTNAHNNDAANASFQPPSLSTMKKPLGR